VKEMPVLGFNITRIEMEKSSSLMPAGQIGVRLTPQVKEIRLGEVRTPTGKINGVEVLFKYLVEYNPQIDKGIVEGGIIYLPSQKEKIDEILNLWEDEKKVDSDVCRDCELHNKGDISRFDVTSKGNETTVPRSSSQG
jgi:hypothetical protein